MDTGLDEVEEGRNDVGAIGDPDTPRDQPWSRWAVAVRVGGVALVVRFAVADREHQPGLIAPGSSTAQAGWQPGEYQQSVAPCQAVSGSLLGRLVRGAPADQDVSSNNPTKLCVWHVGAHTLIVRIQLHSPGGPAGDQTASTLAGADPPTAPSCSRPPSPSRRT